MPIIILICALTLLASTAVEYVVCRFLKHKLWRWAPPAVAFIIAAAVFAARYFGWSADHGGEKAPLETLLFIPILPALLVFLGLYLGWRVWKRRWSPRVINNK